MIKQVKLPKLKRRVYHFAACIHWPVTNVGILDAFVRTVKADSQSRALLLGDQFDGHRTTLRNQLRSVDPALAVFQDDAMYRHVSELSARLKPIAPQILSVSEGNHYAVDSNGISGDQLLCRELGVTFIGSNGVVVVDSGDDPEDRLVIKPHHTGGGNATTATGDAAGLQKQFDKMRADIHVIAHTHDTWGKLFPIEEISADCKRVRRDRAGLRAGVMRRREEEVAGTALPHKPDYTDIKAYGPKAEGWMSVEVFYVDGDRRMRVVGPNR